MGKINLVLIAAGMLLLFSCNKNETIPELGFSPKISASVNDNDSKTKAGVIEDNPNYIINGEQFYWSVDDAATIFFGNESLNYKVASLGTPRSNADFTTTDELSGPGTYDITALFPTSAWDAGNLKATIPWIQEQTDNTSAHLGKYMLMKAYQAGVSVNDKNSVDLGYNHLGAVVRISVWNNSDKTDAILEKVELIPMTNSDPFYLSGSLAGKDAPSLTPDAASQVATVGVSLTGSAQKFVIKDGKKICEAYMVLLPSTTMEMHDAFSVRMTLNDGINPSVQIVNNFIVGVDFPIYSFEQGKSYFFRTMVDNQDWH